MRKEGKSVETKLQFEEERGEMEKIKETKIIVYHKNNYHTRRDLKREKKYKINCSIVGFWQITHRAKVILQSR